MKFRYRCVECPNLSELEHIVDRAKSITHNTFKKHIGVTAYNQLAKSLGYPAGPLTLETDYHVTYHKSKTPLGKTVYYVCHSAIEYVYY